MLAFDTEVALSPLVHGSEYGVQYRSMLRREINILLLHSFFLFGARGVGKTRLLKGLFSDRQSHYIDLLDANEFDRLALDPSLLERVINELPVEVEWIVIDEVQKLPRLLDLVHRNIESKNPRKFALSGSSARKLKRGGANLLAGRAFTYGLYPFTYRELGELFELDSALQWGALPFVSLAHSREEKELYLRTYVQTYLKEEIQVEQVIRSLEPFRKFLQVAAQCSGSIVNFRKIAADVGVTDKTVRNYFQVLEDTLIGFYVEPYHRSLRKRQTAGPKFYLFDCGVQRALSGILTLDVHRSTYEYGKLFEHFIILEFRRLNEYYRKDFEFFYLRTKDDAEIDLIIDRPGKPTALIEIKSTNRVTTSDVSMLEAFRSSFPGSQAYCISQDPKAQRFGEVRALPWRDAIEEIVFS